MIDAHQHFWHYHPSRQTWIPDEMANIRRDFLPADLEPELKQNGINGCVLVQAEDSEAETERLLTLADGATFVKGVVGWVDLTAENVEERLAHYSSNPIFKGLRHALQAYPSEYMLSEKFKKGIAALTQFNLSFDLLVFESQLKAAAELVRAFPYQPFVLDHLAKPNISHGPTAEWMRGIKELAAAGNVYAKISGFLVQTENFQWQPSEFSPWFEVLYSAFGEDRLMFGSDWPVCLAAGEYKDTLELTQSFFAKKGKGVAEKVFGNNAAVFYRL